MAILFGFVWKLSTYFKIYWIANQIKTKKPNFDSKSRSSKFNNWNLFCKASWIQLNWILSGMDSSPFATTGVATTDNNTTQYLTHYTYIHKGIGSFLRPLKRPFLESKVEKISMKIRFVGIRTIQICTIETTNKIRQIKGVKIKNKFWIEASDPISNYRVM